MLWYEILDLCLLASCDIFIAHVYEIFFQLYWKHLICNLIYSYVHMVWGVELIVITGS